MNDQLFSDNKLVTIHQIFMKLTNKKHYHIINRFVFWLIYLDSCHVIGRLFSDNNNFASIHEIFTKFSTPHDQTNDHNSLFEIHATPLVNGLKFIQQSHYHEMSFIAVLVKILNIETCVL